MKKDDYPVIKYKILYELYEAKKYARKINKQILSSVCFNIKSEFWYDIARSLHSDELIENHNGIGISEDSIDKFEISIKGIEYLFSSPLMKEAKEYIDGNKQWEQ